MAGFIESRSEREQVNGLLDRIESGIVAYEEWEIDVREFSSPAELQRSLREVLPRIPVPVIVVALDLPALRAASNAPMLFERHRGCRSHRGILEVDRRYFSGVPRSVDDLAEEWFVSSGDRARTPTLSLSIDGGRVRGFAADHCLSLDDIRDRQSEEERVDSEAGWFGIGFAGLPSLLVVPARRSRLQVHLDHDGSYVALTARDAGDRDRELVRERAYDARWSKWLDDDVALEQRELDETQLRVEAAVTALVSDGNTR